jgi:hypothetical protein
LFIRTASIEVKKFNSLRGKPVVVLNKQRRRGDREACSPAPTIASRSELYNISTITKAPAANKKTNKREKKTSIHSFKVKIEAWNKDDLMPIALAFFTRYHQYSDTNQSKIYNINKCLMSATALQEVVFNIRSYLRFRFI